MKKHLFLLWFLMAWSCTAFAQYQSLFGTVQTSWNVLHESESNYVTDSLVAGEDTVINLITYRKVLFYHLRHKDNLPPLLEAALFLREETATGKAWILYDPSGTEQLFMDLSLSVGETFSVSGLDYPVDSVYTLDGRKHVRVQYAYPVPLDYPVFSGNLTFIEGIGSSYGFTFNFENSGIGGFPTDHYYPFLLCSWKDNEHVYSHEVQNPFFGECYKEDTIVGIGNPFHDPDYKIRIYPNPSSGRFTIETSGIEEIESVTICDQPGKVRCQQTGINSRCWSCECSKLGTGLFFVKVTLTNQVTHCAKVIVK